MSGFVLPDADQGHDFLTSAPVLVAPLPNARSARAPEPAVQLPVNAQSTPAAKLVVQLPFNAHSAPAPKLAVQLPDDCAGDLLLPLPDACAADHGPVALLPNSAGQDDRTPVLLLSLPPLASQDSSRNQLILSPALKLGQLFSLLEWKNMTWLAEQGLGHGRSSAAARHATKPSWLTRALNVS